MKCFFLSYQQLFVVVLCTDAAGFCSLRFVHCTITRTRAWYVAGNYLRELGHVHYSQWTCFARRFPVGRYTRYYTIIQTIRTIHINNSDGGNNFDVQRFPFFSFLFFYDQNDRFDFVQNRNTWGPRLLLRSYGIMLIRLIVIMININNNN